MLIAMRNAMMAGKRLRYAMNSPGDAGSNFTCSFDKLTQDTDMTVSFWFKPNANQIHGAIVHASGITTSGNGTGFALGYGSGSSNMEHDGRYANVLYNTMSWRGGYYMASYSSWHHYACVMTAGSYQGIQHGSSCRNFTAVLYIDGVSVKNFGSYRMLNDLSKLYVLGLTDANDFRWVNGQVTRLCLRLGRALTATEIADEFVAGFNAPDMADLSHYWDGTENRDGKVEDHVGDWHLDINGNASVVALTE